MANLTRCLRKILAYMRGRSHNKCDFEYGNQSLQGSGSMDKRRKACDAQTERSSHSDSSNTTSVSHTYHIGQKTVVIDSGRLKRSAATAMENAIRKIEGR